MQELCGEVRGFVRMTDAGGLPPEILDGGKEALQTLLNGMLAHFICSEIIASPMWVFAATSLGTLESPGIVPPKPMPSLPGLRMDMSTFADVAPQRPGPVETPRSPQFPPPLITSMIPSLGNSASCLGLPLKPDMERLVHMLTDAQRDDARVTAHHWRAQMMRLFADGGFSIKDVAAAGNNESRRTFVESRLNYARKLKERFLGGSARFLLQDQDARGIERLESKLTELIDDALRFSCRLWTRMAPVRLYGWKDMGSKEIKASTSLVTLCHAQVEVESRRHRAQQAGREKPPQDGQTEQLMVMAVQPAVLAENISLPLNSVGRGDDGMALVWLKARVMLAGPMSVDGPEPEPDVAGATTPSKPSSPPSPPAEDTASKSTTGSGASPQPGAGAPQTCEVLPAASFKAPPGKKATDY
ncbi:hypothetical protein MYCTH_2303046 [Thermothelomyces thermophilus ATCC 42464]|uniref:Uncharacterized protein n=1 Tax=Thermothelomyces thermophilus (strain ATCC 42464 / BCRC 31852 / DSM 1799) TaxID=573729 RepID=G2Q999_THET4|nr:uncharacterized protein MYCTH_2303046 [Thermothelomyces thermophilus ATCC 42464]AEO57191.1 hypothetical protein MYCTH_2303046 [Thermothelomyces thermophilus ATCC 42464]